MPDINGIPYVESTDLVSAYPAASQSLAQAVSDELASKLDLAGGKILQVVRATDTTDRSTSSTSYVDASISVTITPQKNTSAILLIWSLRGVKNSSTGARMQYRITDASNNAISGTQDSVFGAGNTVDYSQQNLIGYATPATTSATTYKGRFSTSNAAVANTIENTLVTGQLYAIEVSA